jgi:hypothetical protein
MTDRKALFDQLANAQRLVTASEERIRAQKRAVADLQRDGKDSASAKEVLAELEKAHALYVGTLNQVREQLSFR